MPLYVKKFLSNNSSFDGAALSLLLTPRRALNTTPLASACCGKMQQ
jgi:hypothetical protein